MPVVSRSRQAGSVLAILLASACTQSSAAKAADSAVADSTKAEATATSNLLLPVAASEARDGDLVLSVATTGQVRSDGEATLKAEVAGRSKRSWFTLATV